MSSRAMEGDFSRITAVVRKEGKAVERKAVHTALEEYNSLFDEKKGGSVESRKGNYTTLVNHFYDLMTDFYEFGWGHSFHFATRHKWESFEASIARHEMWLAHKLELVPGQRVLDVGCGIGGPMRCIARFSGAHIVGLNNNDYQIERGKRLNTDQGLNHLTSFMKADFMHIPAEDNTYDAVYQVEATCHAPDKTGVYKEIYRVLKPGQLFGGYEWIITNKYDANKPDHVRVKTGIEVGNGLPELELPSHIISCLKEAGFEVLESRDLAETSSLPWYLPLSPSFSIYGFMHTGFGRKVTGFLVNTLEKLKIAPQGSTEAHRILENTAFDLVEGGSKEIFSPMFFILARKPLDKK